MKAIVIRNLLSDSGIDRLNAGIEFQRSGAAYEAKAADDLLNGRKSEIKQRFAIFNLETVGGGGGGGGGSNPLVGSTALPQFLVSSRFRMPVQQMIPSPLDRGNLPMMHRMPFMGQPDFRIYEMNRRLQQWTEDTDNLWWEAFATEFFEDDATLTLTFCLEDGMKQYTVSRTLIPRYFRSLFEGGVVEVYFVLKHSKESFHNTAIVLDCDQATTVTHHTRPVFTKVLTEGRLVLEFTFDDLMRIRIWHFTIRQHCELIPRSLLAMQQQDPVLAEQLSQNVTRQGLTNYTLNFLRLCVILEPMQELMSRHKAYGLTPRDCLKTTLFQKWQKMVAPPETNRQPNKRRKRKYAVGANGAANGTPSATRLKRSPEPQSFNPVLGDVMIVGEPTLMGGEFGDKDERLIARDWKNVQFNPNEQECNVEAEPQHSRVLACGSSSVAYASGNQNIQQLQQRIRPCSPPLQIHDQWNQDKSIQQQQQPLSQVAKATNDDRPSGSEVD